MKHLQRAALVAALALPASMTWTAALTLTLIPPGYPVGGGPITVQVSASGGEPIDGVDLLLFVGDGGPNFGGVSDPATAPKIVGGTVTEGTIFAGNHTGTTYLNLDLGDGPEPLAAVMNTTTQFGTVPAQGIIGFFTLDLTGTVAGFYEISLDPDNTFVGGVPPTSITNALLAPPEPASALLLVAAIPFVRRRPA